MTNIKIVYAHGRWLRTLSETRNGVLINIYKIHHSFGKTQYKFMALLIVIPVTRDPHSSVCNVGSYRIFSETTGRIFFTTTGDVRFKEKMVHVRQRISPPSVSFDFFSLSHVLWNYLRNFILIWPVEG